MAARRSTRRGSSSCSRRLMHPAMRHVGPVRRELGDPDGDEHRRAARQPGARPGARWSGVAEAQRLPLIAGALARARHACTRWSCTASPGLDEISPLGPTRVVEIRRRRATREWTIDPARYGFARVRAERPRRRQPRRRTRAVILDVLGGGGTAGARAAVILNAAAALYVAAGSAADVRRRAWTAATSRALERWRRLRAAGAAARTRTQRQPARRAIEARSCECVLPYSPRSPAPEPARRSAPRALVTSVPAQHADDDALDRDVVLVHVDRLHRLVRRLEANAAVALAIELLDRGRGAVASAR